jgi:hypothetical protein
MPERKSVNVQTGEVTFEPYTPLTPPTKAERVSRVNLPRQVFFKRLSSAANLGASEADITDWLKEQVKASGFTNTQKRRFAELIDTAISFPRIDDELGDVMTPLGAIFGLSKDQIDDFFLGAAVSIDRTKAPIKKAIPSKAAEIKALKTKIAELEGRIAALEGV